MLHRQPAGRERGIRLVSHDTDSATAGLVCPGITPRLTEWVPELLTELRAHTERTIRTHTTDVDPWRVSSTLLTDILPGWQHPEQSWSDDVAEAVAYTRAITALALTYTDECGDRSAYHRQRHADLTDTVTTVGTGRGPVNAGLGALAKGPIALHRALDDQPRVLTLLLDGEAWTDLADRRTGVRALAAIAVLAHGFDIRIVASPALQRHLTTRYPRWTETHLVLTGSRERSPHTDHRTRQSQSVDAAYDAIRDLDTAPGKRRLLGTLDVDQARRYHDLGADQTIDIATGTISRYVLDLETRGLVTVDRRGQYNAVQLTELGHTAVTQCLDDTHKLVHPQQRRLDTSLTATPHELTSTVSPRRAGPPGETAPTTDEQVAATGDTDGDADYVQWLGDPDTTHTTQLHQRFSTVAHDDSITLVNEQLDAFEDGRVAYLSHTDDETLVILQWGGPLATLGRLAGALLSDKALSHILTPSRLGDAFETIHDTDFGHDAPRILRRGHQVGWYSDDETTFEAWRDRITTVRDQLLTRLAALTSSDDTAARSDLFEDLHGLVATATHLYHAAGIDLTTTIRLPDTETLARNTSQRDDLCAFLAKTVPKQSVYGVHSGYRMLFENRPAKLCRRLPSKIEPDTQLDLTMSWVLAGPTITALSDPITTALTEEFADTREAIANGIEHAPTLEIPVRDGTTYPAIRRVIDEIAMTHDVQWTSRERQRLVRLCLRSFGPSDTTHSACPYDVVASLLRALNESQTPTPADFERAAATLPATRFRPDLTSTATKLYATLLRTDEPLGRSELIERAEISASSYDRRLSDVRALDRVTAVHVDGHRRWTTENPTVPPVASTPPICAHTYCDQLSTPLVTHRHSTRLTPASVGHTRRWRLRHQTVRHTACLPLNTPRLFDDQSIHPRPGLSRGRSPSHPSTAPTTNRSAPPDSHQTTLPTETREVTE